MSPVVPYLVWAMCLVVFGPATALAYHTTPTPALRLQSDSLLVFTDENNPIWSRDPHRYADTTTDTTTAVWRACERRAKQVRETKHKHKAEYSDFADYNPKRYPCVRDWPVYAVKANEFANIFLTTPAQADTHIAADTAHVVMQVMGDGMSYLGAKEFEGLKQKIRDSMLDIKPGSKLVVLLNHAPVSDATAIDLDHIRYIEVMSGAYAATHSDFKHTAGVIDIVYIVRP